MENYLLNRQYHDPKLAGKGYQPAAANAASLRDQFERDDGQAMRYAWDKPNLKSSVACLPLTLQERGKPQWPAWGVCGPEPAVSLATNTITICGAQEAPAPRLHRSNPSRFSHVGEEGRDEWLLSPDPSKKPGELLKGAELRKAMLRACAPQMGFDVTM
jgi:hypothetical protein